MQSMAKAAAPTGLTHVVPALRVRDLTAALAWYGVLGFAPVWTHQYAPQLPRVARVVCDRVALLLTEHAGDCAFGGLVYFYGENLTDLTQRLHAAGVAPARAMGHFISPDFLDLLLVDPDGNRLIFIEQDPKPAPSADPCFKETPTP